MKFYKDATGFWLNGELTPQGFHTLQVDTDNATISRFRDNYTIYNGLISGLLKENGTGYSSKADLLSAVGDFFVDAAQVAANEVLTLAGRVEVLEEHAYDTIWLDYWQVEMPAISADKYWYDTAHSVYYCDGVEWLEIYGDNTLPLSQTKFYIKRSDNTTYAWSGRDGLYYSGQIKSHIIRSQALTQQQVTAEYTYLRSVYPEIESVQIGTQTWATSNCEMAATPMSNVIQEMQAAGNVEKIANGGFDTDTVWIKQAGWSISGGVATRTSDNTASWIYQSTLNVGKWYKATFTITSYTSGRICIGAGGARGTYRNAVGTYTEFIYCIVDGFAGVLCETNDNFVGSVDNISFQEIGWSGSQELYDGIYAQTSGTVEQKTYTAVKAAAMWCHYNNSVDNGAIYGKLYNWCSVYLLQRDIWNYCMTGSNVVAQPYNGNKVYYVRINAKTSGVGTVTINANGRGSSNIITLSTSDKLYELYVNGTDGVIPTITYSGTGSMTTTEFTMYEDIWGWRVPTQADFQTLSTYLGGDAVSGGKLKLAGTTYWNSPNTGADNSSGFSALGGGLRNIDGNSINLLNDSRLSTISEIDSLNINAFFIQYNTVSISLLSNSKVRGLPLRLIKA